MGQRCPLRRRRHQQPESPSLISWAASGTAGIEPCPGRLTSRKQVRSRTQVAASRSCARPVGWCPCRGRRIGVRTWRGSVSLRGQAPTWTTNLSLQRRGVDRRSTSHHPLGSCHLKLRPDTRCSHRLEAMCFVAYIARENRISMTSTRTARLPWWRHRSSTPGSSLISTHH